MDDDRRTRVREAALEVFLRHGYRKVTMDDIAQGAGISRPALYLVFPNKEAVFREVVRVGLDDLVERIEQGLTALTTPAEQLGYVFDVSLVDSFDLVARAPAAAELLHASFDFVADLFEHHEQRMTAIITQVLREAVDDPDALDPSAEARARVVRAATHGCKAAAHDVDDLRRLVADLVAMTLAGLPIRAGRGTKVRARGRRP